MSVCFNVGIGSATSKTDPGFLGSTFLKRINAGDMAGARDAILMWKKPTSIISRREAEAEQFVTGYAVALPRATTKAKPIAVAAPVIAILHPKIATPVIVPVAPAVTARPNLLGRILRWIDDTYGDGTAATANDHAPPAIGHAA